jgi:hypothetical protein
MENFDQYKEILPENLKNASEEEIINQIKLLPENECLFCYFKFGQCSICERVGTYEDNSNKLVKCEDCFRLFHQNCITLTKGKYTCKAHYCASCNKKDKNLLVCQFCP